MASIHPLKDLAKKKLCKICHTATSNVFNIDFKAVPICEDCATAIFIQQATFYCKKHKNEDQDNCLLRKP